MALNTTNPTGTEAWKNLQNHYNATHTTTIQELFQQDAARVEKFNLQWNDFLVDYSKNNISQETIALLLELANTIGLKDAIAQYFGGEIINQTENRAVLHTALRAPESTVIKVDGENVIPEVYEVKNKIKNFTHEIISGERKGFSGKAFTDVVNIGIGGSDLGPVMAVEALQFYKNHLNIHFVSNVDGDHVNEVIKKLNPETTLFVIVSKTFTTQETLTNSETIKEWFLKSATQQDIAKHFVAVSTNIQKVTEFGINPANVFPMWDWVGGRFSLWSAVGLSIALSIGFDNYNELLKGANEMDAGIYYAPYVALTPLRGSDPKNFQPVMGFKTRYGIGINPFADSASQQPNARIQSGMPSIVNSVGKNAYFRRIWVKGL